MKFPRRAVEGAAVKAGVRVTRRAAAVIAALALVWSTGNLQAMTRVQHAHLRPVSQDQESGPSHTKSSHKSTHKSHESHSAEHETGKTHSKARRHHAEPEPVDDPVPMHRASRESRREETLKERERRELEIAREHTHLGPRLGREPEPSRHHAHKQLAAQHPTHREVVQPAHEQEQARSSESTPALTVDDFVRAAQGDESTAPAAASTAPTEKAAAVYGAGVAHPQETVEQKTAAEVTAAATLPQAAPAQPKPQTPLTADAHPQGFGAEPAVVAPTHRTLARTMAEYRAEMKAHKQAPTLTADEQNEITDEAVQPEVLPAIYGRDGRLEMPAPLKGSREVLIHQNTMADNEGLERIANDSQLERLEARHELTRLPESASLHVNSELPVERRYARPWAVQFAVDMAKAYQQRFGEPLEVNSAVRTVNYQLRLMRVNGNAAAVEGDTASPHLTGQALDFGKRDMSKAEIAWMRAYLLPLMQAGKIDVEEEFQQACFHISVYRSYVQPNRRSLRMEMANQLRRAAAAEAETPATFAPPQTDGDN